MFNELSLQKVNSKQIALDVLEGFVKASVRASELGISELRLYEDSIHNLYQLTLYSDYNIDKWLNDREVNSDIQDRFREIVTSFPLITEIEVRENEYYQRSEFNKTLDGTDFKVYGLGAAYIYGTLAISLKTNLEWEKSMIQISHYHLNIDGDDSYDDVYVKHFCNTETLDRHLQWWQQTQKESLNKSLELWQRKDDFFSNITLCAEVEKQLEKIGVSKMLFQIIERLRTLDEYAKKWQTGNFNYEDVNATTNLRISPESYSTLRLFSSMRRFVVPGQGKKLFDLHIKTGDLRFHFYPDNNTKMIYIGYIGKHLRIASEN